jgi:hypothetical protein
MSHNIKLSGVKFTELVTLGQVIKDVSKGTATLVADAQTFRTYRGQSNKCDAAIKLPGGYDIGLLKGTTGYEPIMESALLYTGTVLGPRGAPLGFVQQEFALREAEYEAAQRGYTATREEGPNGRISLRIGVPD